MKLEEKNNDITLHTTLHNGLRRKLPQLLEAPIIIYLRNLFFLTKYVERFCKFQPAALSMFPYKETAKITLIIVILSVPSLDSSLVNWNVLCALPLLHK